MLKCVKGVKVKQKGNSSQIRPRLAKQMITGRLTHSLTNFTTEPSMKGVKGYYDCLFVCCRYEG